MGARKLSDNEKKDILEHFEERDGFLYWKKRPRFNSRGVPGRQAGSIEDRYCRTSLKGIRYPVHRIIYFLHTGEWPEEVDHINGITTDNRIENLRAATRLGQVCNCVVSSRNKLGIKGISYDKKRKRFAAYINTNNHTINLGRFKTIEEALSKRIEAERKYQKEFAVTEDRRFDFDRLLGYGRVG